MEDAKCLQTDLFKSPGQNFLTIGTNSSTYNLNQFLNDTVYFWGKEKEEMKQNSPDCCLSFNQLIHDKANAVGCAVSQYAGKLDKESIDVLIICNFSHKNVEGKPSYEEGKIASKCPNGKDTNYGNLCKSVQTTTKVIKKKVKKKVTKSPRATTERLSQKG